MVNLRNILEVNEQMQQITLEITLRLLLFNNDFEYHQLFLLQGFFGRTLPLLRWLPKTAL